MTVLFFVTGCHSLYKQILIGTSTNIIRTSKERHLVTQIFLVFETALLFSHFF